MSKKRNSIIIFLVVIVLSVAAAIFAYPPIMKKIDSDQYGRSYRFGLDIAGGAQLVYEVDMKDVLDGDRDLVINGLRDVIERRVNIFGVSEPRVVTAKSGENYRLIVELAGIRNISEAIMQIGSTPLLDFREVSITQPGASSLSNGLDDESQDEDLESAMDHDDVESEAAQEGTQMEVEYILTDLTGRYIKSAQMAFDQTTQEPFVSLEFNKEGGEIFEELTGRNVGRPLAIFLDGIPISSPVVQQKISGGRAQITGSFTVDEVRELVERFNAGALPAPITLVSQQTVDAMLGQEALGLGIIGGILGTLAVIIFMLIYYGRLGVFASVALVIYVFITIAIFKLIPVTLTLAGIAGFILSIGMAVDANILIFERTNEELAKGLKRKLAIEEGFRRAWPSIRDSNLSTIITALVLYFFTTSIVKGFALTLLIGVLVSMLSAILITRNMLRVFATNEKK